MDAVDGAPGAVRLSLRDIGGDRHGAIRSGGGDGGLYGDAFAPPRTPRPPPTPRAATGCCCGGGRWSILAYWIIIRTQILPRTEERIEKNRAHPWLVSGVISLMFLIGDFLLELPWTIYAQWWREKQYGLTSQMFGGWISEELMQFAISTVFTIIFLVVLYALIRRAPRTWWAWAGALAAFGFLFLMVIGPIFIEPLFNKYTPAPPGQVRDAVVALAKQAGVPYDKIYIYNGCQDSPNRYTANVSGLGSSAAAVAMSDVMSRQGRRHRRGARRGRPRDGPLQAQPRPVADPRRQPAGRAGAGA